LLRLVANFWNFNDLAVIIWEVPDFLQNKFIQLYHPRESLSKDIIIFLVTHFHHCHHNLQELYSICTRMSVEYFHNEKVNPNKISTNKSNNSNKNKIMYLSMQSDSIRSVYSFDSEDTGSVASTSITTTTSYCEKAESNNLHFCSKKLVRFSTVTIREYKRCLGQSTVPSSGPPVSIVWEYDNEMTHEVDDYEDSFGYCGERRSKAELQMPGHYRSELLRDLGHSRMEIQQTILRTNKVRRQRRQTIETMRWHSMEDISRRTFQKLVHGSCKVFTAPVKSSFLLVKNFHCIDPNRLRG
jgi:hypothetical protein